MPQQQQTTNYPSYQQLQNNNITSYRPKTNHNSYNSTNINRYKQLLQKSNKHHKLHLNNNNNNKKHITINHHNIINNQIIQSLNEQNNNIKQQNQQILTIQKQLKDHNIFHDNGMFQNNNKRKIIFNSIDKQKYTFYQQYQQNKNQNINLNKNVINKLYDKIQISNKNDPLHPSSYRNYFYNQQQIELFNQIINQNYLIDNTNTLLTQKNNIIQHNQHNQLENLTYNQNNTLLKPNNVSDYQSNKHFELSQSLQITKSQIKQKNSINLKQKKCKCPTFKNDKLCQHLIGKKLLILSNKNQQTARSQFINHNLRSMSIEEENQNKDRKKFFKMLLKKFTENNLLKDQENFIAYKQKVNLFKKLFQHYKLKTQEKQQFNELFTQLQEKQSQEINHESKISTKMTLQTRRVHRTSQEKRFQVPKFRLKDKSLQTVQRKRINGSQYLSINSRDKQTKLRQLNSTCLSVNDRRTFIGQNQRNKQSLDSSNIFIENQKGSMKGKSFDKKNNLNALQPLQNKVQTPIDIKLQKFRQFLFAINYGNNLYVPLQIQKYNQTIKVFIGKGNNSNLIRSILKKRFWFEITKNIKQANFIWTQIKQPNVFERQKGKQFYLNNNIKQRGFSQSQNRKKRRQILEKQLIKQINPEQVYSQIKQGKHDLIFQKKIQIKFKQNTEKSHYLSVKNSKQKSIINKKQLGESIQDKVMKLKKYNPLININKIKKPLNPLQKILSLQGAHIYQALYGQIGQNEPSKFTSKFIPFKDRKGQVLSSSNGLIMKEQEKNNMVIHNHLPVNGILGNKKAMFYILKEYCQLVGKNVFDIVPLTYHIKNGLKDQQFKSFLQTFQHRKKSKISNHWVMKPGQFSNRGNGIQCTNKIQQIRKRVQNCVNMNQKKSKGCSKSVILQSYITNPLLYNGRKFDIRAYMLTTIVNGKIKAYWYEQGYIRTSSYIWSLEEIEDRQIHLTNDAVQKYAQTYGKFQPGNKLSYRDLQRYLQTFEKAPKNLLYDKIVPYMKQVATESLKASYLFLDPKKLQNNFQIFGFDFMIDRNMKPWLIEINTNPCLQLGCPLLQRIIPNMVQNAFRIAIDPLFPPPSTFSSLYKYNIAQNAINYNKFHLIFDQAQDGPRIKKIYQNANLEQILVKIQDIQQDKQTFQQQGQEIDIKQLDC